MTAESYEDFELRLEWKISPNGNSGIIYNVVEGDNDRTYQTGPEMQVLDNDCHPDGKIEKRSEEHTSELQSLMRISYAVFCLKKKKKTQNNKQKRNTRIDK